MCRLDGGLEFHAAVVAQRRLERNRGLAGLLRSGDALRKHGVKMDGNSNLS